MLREGRRTGPGAIAPQPFFLYMASIRWVTRKPPKMLTAASAAATAPDPLDTQALAPDFEDEILKGACLTRDGQVVHPALQPQ